MKTFLTAVGLAVPAVSFLIEINSRHSSPLSLGLWLFAGAALIAAAFWSPQKRDGHYYQFAGNIYAALATGGMTFSSLIEEIVAVTYDDRVKDHARKVVVTMLDEGTLVMVDGNVCLASGGRGSA